MSGRDQIRQAAVGHDRTSLPGVHEPFGIGGPKGRRERIHLLEDRSRENETGRVANLVDVLQDRFGGGRLERRAHPVTRDSGQDASEVPAPHGERLTVDVALPTGEEGDERRHHLGYREVITWPCVKSETLPVPPWRSGGSHSPGPGGVQTDIEIYRQEVFGPVLSFVRVDDLQQARIYAEIVV